MPSAVRGLAQPRRALGHRDVAERREELVSLGRREVTRSHSLSAGMSLASVKPERASAPQMRLDVRAVRRAREPPGDDRADDQQTAQARVAPSSAREPDVRTRASALGAITWPADSGCAKVRP